jgi:predicted AAA+ superfamily ATPase
MKSKLESLAGQFPVVAIMGPRQSGKTTLARATFKDFHYISLEEFKDREFATSDPKSFLEAYSHHKGLILDEIQEAPSLLSYMQGYVDKNNKPGMFIITGSQNFLLNEKITQTLAGRVAILTLLPLSVTELLSYKQDTKKEMPQNGIFLDELLFTGCYPRLYSDLNVSPLDFYPAHIRTYVEKDVRQIRNVEDLVTFQRFIGLCAGRIGQILNISSLANDCGISVPTAKAWISILAASYIIFLLQPHYKNFNKRLIKSPKLYFYDSGLACSILKIESKDQLINYYGRGNLFESFIISEMQKQRYNIGREPNLYFWRDKTGHEVDCIIEKATELIPVEIKSGKTISSDFFDGLDYWCELSGSKPEKSFLIYGGDENQKRSKGTVLGWRSVDKIFAD